MTKNPESVLVPSTEEKIVVAAMEVFITRGYHGARMREIARKANTNLALLNYYFRSKENLFKTVCLTFVDKIYSRLAEAFKTQTTLEESIQSLVCVYIDMLLENESLPLFFVNILAQNPELLSQTFQSKNFVKDLFPNFFQQIESEIAKGRIRNIQPPELLLNCLSLCIFPFLAAPTFKNIFAIQNTEFRELMAQRKTHVTHFILNAIFVSSHPLPLLRPQGCVD